MAHEHSSLEDRVESLSAEFAELRNRVDALTQRIDGPTPTRKHHLHVSPTEHDETLNIHAPMDGGQFAEFLSEVAIVCFVLVIALVLRTLVDNGIVQQRAGSLAGMGYAALVSAFGYYRYAAQRKRAAVFVICGAVLYFSIVLETHARFGIFSAVFAYTMLDAALVAMTVASLRYSAYLPLCVGVLGAGLTGIVVQFPEAVFSHLVVLLILGVLAAHSISFVRNYRWMPWCQFSLVLFFWMSWTIQLHHALTGGTRSPEEFAGTWFLPGVVVFAAIYLLTVLWSSLRDNWPVGYFELALPTLTVAWASVVARTIAVPRYGDAHPFGIGGVIGVVILLALSIVLSYRGNKATHSSTAFVAGAFVLFVPSMPALFDNFLVVLLAWTIVALCVGIVAARSHHRAMQFLTYVFAAFVALAAVAHGQLLGTPASLTGGIVVTVSLVGLSLLHLLVRPDWHRHAVSGHWLLVNRDDRGGAVLLAAAALYSFCASRLMLYFMLVQLGGESGAVFQCSQTMLINGFALLLMGLAISCTSIELVFLSFVFAFAGGGKVFGYDMWFTSGLPLVFSVSSFAVATALGSLLWTRWQHVTAKSLSFTKI